LNSSSPPGLHYCPPSWQRLSCSSSVSQAFISQQCTYTLVPLPNTDEEHSYPAWFLCLEAQYLVWFCNCQENYHLLCNGCHTVEECCLSVGYCYDLQL
jgi:hypothetical protein